MYSSSVIPLKPVKAPGSCIVTSHGEKKTMDKTKAGRELLQKYNFILLRIIRCQMPKQRVKSFHAMPTVQILMS